MKKIACTGALVVSLIGASATFADKTINNYYGPPPPATTAPAAAPTTIPAPAETTPAASPCGTYQKSPADAHRTSTNVLSLVMLLLPFIVITGAQKRFRAKAAN